MREDKHLSLALQKAESEARAKALKLYQGGEIPGVGGEAGKMQ